MTTIKVFEESNRLYVEVENPPKELKAKLVALSTDGIINSLAGFVEQKESVPDGFRPAKEEDDNPFEPKKEEPNADKPKRAAKKEKSRAELEADNDWA